MDSGNMSEVFIEDAKPTEAVAADVEVIEGEPQPETIEQSEVYIEDEGDSEQPNGMDEGQLKAAFRQEREKRKRKNAELEEERNKRAELEERLARAEKLAIEAALGKKPLPSDFVDAVDYAEAVENYQKKAAELNPQNKPQAQQAQTNGMVLDEEQEFHAYKTREEMRKHLPDFDDAEKRFDQEIAGMGLNTASVKNGLIALTHLHGIDYAKAIYALDRIPAMKEKLKTAPNDAAIARIMKEAAEKVKIRQPQKIDTKPEPELTSSGAVHATAQKVEKLKAKWAETGSAADYKALSEARKQLKAELNG